MSGVLGCKVCLSEFIGSYSGNVHLTNQVFPRTYVLAGFGDEDASSLATRVRLTDVRFVFFGPGVSLKVTVTVGRGKLIKFCFHLEHFTARH